MFSLENIFRQNELHGTENAVGKSYSTIKPWALCREWNCMNLCSEYMTFDVVYALVVCDAFAKLCGNFLCRIKEEQGEAVKRTLMSAAKKTKRRC